MASRKGKKICILASIMIGITAISTLITYGVSSPGKQENHNLSIVTSFYPMYIATLNLTDGVDGIEVENLMNQQVGCPHDYQLATTDMKILENADVLVINGAGMESYIEEVAANYQNLTIIDSSTGINLLKGEEHDHEEEADHDHEEEADHLHEEEHDHGAYNGHIWMDPERYLEQLDSIAAGLIARDSIHKEQYEANLKAYKQRIQTVWDEYQQLGEPTEKQVIIFHDAMEYILDRLGVEVAYSIDMDGESSLSAGEIAEVIEQIKVHNIKVLFIEEQFDTNIANRIAEETGARVYVLDTMVSGEVGKDAYLNSLSSNLSTLKEAMY